MDQITKTTIKTKNETKLKRFLRKSKTACFEKKKTERNETKTKQNNTKLNDLPHSIKLVWDPCVV